MADVVPVPVVSARDLGGDAGLFYARHAHRPVIVRDCYPPGHPLRDLDLDGIEALMDGIPIRGHGAAAESSCDIPAAEIFAGVRGHGEPYNVVDFHLRGTALGRLCDVPPFLRDNWFLGAPANQDQYEKSLVASPAGAFTPLHLDSYAMQGWMFLIAGRKTWTCYAPESVGAAFDPRRRRFFNSRADPPEDFPDLARCTRYEGEIGPGDLFYFPAGWIHEVATHTISYGVGGSVLNDYQIEEHVKWWLWEREMEFAGSLDLARVIQGMPPHRFSGDAGRSRAAAALALCRSQVSRRRLVDD